MNDFNIGLAVVLLVTCATLITWITKLRKENIIKDEQISDKDDEIAIKSRAIEYQKKIIDQMAKKSANGKHG